MDIIHADFWDESHHLFKSIYETTYPFVSATIALLIFFLLGIIFRIAKFDTISHYRNIVNLFSGSSNIRTKELLQNPFVNILLKSLFTINSGILFHFFFVGNLHRQEASYALKSFFWAILAAAGFYLFNSISFKVVSYFFFTKELTAKGVKFMNSLSKLLGILLSIPSIMFLLASDKIFLFSQITVIIIALFALTLTLIYIGNNFFFKPISIFYLILYLCILEITPIFWVFYFVKQPDLYY